MSTKGLTEDEILHLIETAEGEDLVALAEMLEAKIKIDGYIKELDQLGLEAVGKEKSKKPKSKAATESSDDVFVCEHDGLRVTWTKNKDGGWTPTATRILGENEAGALRGHYSKELETAIEFSIPLLKKHLAAKAGGHGKAGKSSHPYKELILKHMKNSRLEGNSLKQFLLQWEYNPLEGSIALKEAGVGQYEVAGEESAPKPYTFKTFENYWGECK